ncbi:putative uridine kinase [Colletotrichum trifolii]|uniref:Putative uridine kinase n=1 Tax=Colletotrichum trifolii TaxID=5466 RepID=A0A4V3HVD2_COLTR|nr:putative uridine kinase [Colletotrichum trifolii]
MEATYRTLVQRILSKWEEKQNSPPEESEAHPRLIIALAGPPGSGKTTIAQRVLSALSSTAEPRPKTVVLSADGFHLPLAALHAMPNASEAIARRGVPWTFDGQGAVDLVRELRAATGRRHVSAPTFDHKVKDPVFGGATVDADVQVCVIEGLYLLVDEEPWGQIAPLVDDRWLVRVEPALARTRVAVRHVAAGIEDTMEKALYRTDTNDMVNGAFVAQRSEGRYDVLVDSVEELPN